ncbi:hypothetical protein ACUY28_08720 [Corynebacterium sanguinis]
MAIGVNPGGGVESIADERGNLNGTVRKQAWVDELCDVGGSRPTGQVVVGRKTPFSPATPFAPAIRPKVLVRRVFNPEVG